MAFETKIYLSDERIRKKVTKIPNKKTADKIIDEFLEGNNFNINDLYKIIHNNQKKLSIYLKYKNDKKDYNFYKKKLNELETNKIDMNTFEKNMFKEFKEMFKKLEDQRFSSDSKSAFKSLHNLFDFKYSYKKEGEIINETIDENGKLINNRESFKLIYDDFKNIHSDRNNRINYNLKFPKLEEIKALEII